MERFPLDKAYLIPVFSNCNKDSLTPSIGKLLDSKSYLVAGNRITDIVKYFGAKCSSSNGRKTKQGYGVMFKLDELQKRFTITHGLFE